MASIHDQNMTAFLGVDPAFRAARVSMWPKPSLGEYRLGQSTGLLTAIAANSEIFQFRWGSATHIAEIKFVKVRYTVITGFTAAQELAFDIAPSISWSVSGSSGAVIVPAANNLKKRSSYEDAKTTDLRIATTTALGAGTKTLSVNPLLACSAKTLAAAATVQDAVFEAALDMTNSGDGPLILSQNEGFSVRNTILLGAGGTVRASIEVAWAEFLAADYPTF